LASGLARICEQAGGAFTFGEAGLCRWGVWAGLPAMPTAHVALGQGEQAGAVGCVPMSGCGVCACVLCEPVRGSREQSYGKRGLRVGGERGGKVQAAQHIRLRKLPAPPDAKSMEVGNGDAIHGFRDALAAT
jgi:hypothetical protein